MILNYILILLMTLLGAISSLFLKKASGSNSIYKIFFNINLWIGGFLYFISAIFNIIVLKELDYSVVLPITSLTYVWTFLLAYFIFKEKMSIEKLCGIILVVLGAFCVSST